MAKPMTKAAIISTLTRKSGLPRKQVVVLLDQLWTLAVKEAKSGFVLPGFGKLVVNHRKARMGRHPQTGAPIPIPARRVLKFRAAKSLKDAVLGKT